MEIPLEILNDVLERNMHNHTFIFAVKEFLMVLKKLDREVSYIVFPRVPAGAVSSGIIYVWIQKVLQRLAGSGIVTIPWSLELNEYRTDQIDRIHQQRSELDVETDDVYFNNSVLSAASQTTLSHNQQHNNSDLIDVGDEEEYFDDNASVLPPVSELGNLQGEDESVFGEGDDDNAVDL